jgi:hypothetical protein
MSVAGRTRRGPNRDRLPRAAFRRPGVHRHRRRGDRELPGPVGFTTGTSTSLIVAPRVWRSARTADTSPLPATPAPAAPATSEMPVPVVPDTCYRHALGASGRRFKSCQPDKRSGW